MLSEEEKKAIEFMKFYKKHCLKKELENMKNYKTVNDGEFVSTNIEIVLNLIEKQQAEIEKKDNTIKSKDKEIKLLKEFHNKHIKIIDKMADEMINGIYKFKDKRQIIEYFTNKVK